MVDCLPAEVTCVWGACTGSNTVAEIASVTETDEQTVVAAADQLMQGELPKPTAFISKRNRGDRHV
jgi:hypothetical protein